MAVKKRATQTSKGERRPVNKSVTKQSRREYLASGARLMNQLDAFQAGKRVVYTVPNPIKTETNKPFIKLTGEQMFGGEFRKLPKFSIGNKN